MQYFTLFCLCLITFIQGSSTLDTSAFREQTVTQHNVYRAEQCAGPLQRNSTLDQIAQDYCRDMVRTGTFAHSNRTDIGENSYQKIPWDPKKDNGATPVIHWYMERSNYTVTDPGRTLHYTQLVWKATKMIGVGVCEISSNNGLIVVANYFPRGNYENQFAQNVGCSN